MISVITPTIRPEGLHLVEKSLKRQTHTDFEWIVIAPQEISVKGFKRIDVLLSDPPKTGNMVWTLNRAYNKAIRASHGDLIVSWQDFTSTEPEALERLQIHFDYDSQTIVSGVGDKFEKDDWIDKVWVDPRRKTQTYRRCDFRQIEWNFCSVPKRALYEIGGFDEKLDELGYGMDGYSVNERLNDSGWGFALDETLETKSVAHGRVKDWDEKNLISGGYERRKNELHNLGTWPVVEYLKSENIVSANER